MLRGKFFIKGISILVTLIMVMSFVPIVIQAATLATPANVYVDGDGNGAVLHWDVVADATGYTIFRGTGKYSTAAFTEVATVTGQATDSYDIGTNYAWDYYKVRANAGADDTNSAQSAVASLEFTTFTERTEIFTTGDAMGNATTINTVANRLEYYQRMFFWGGNTGSNNPAANANAGLPAGRANNQFTDDRVALFFRPNLNGTTAAYSISMWLNFYMHIAGLGKVPTEVTVNNVQVGSWEGGSYNSTNNGNVTQNFWRQLENIHMTATGNFWFGVSQASPVRRVSTPGSMQFQLGGTCSASGGYISDSKANNFLFYGHQQFYGRNNQIQTWNMCIWNALSQGTTNNAGTGLPTYSSYVGVVVPQTPIIAEKPFLYFDITANDNTGDYKVFVPGYRTDSAGNSWGAGKPNDGMGVGEAVPLSKFFIAKQGMTADQIIAGMKTKNGNIFFTPGVYELSKEIRVTEPNAVLLGIGMATLRPTEGNVCIRVADVQGVRVAGLMLDAGPAPSNDFANASEALVVVGENSCSSSPEMEAAPIILSDVFVRVGGRNTTVPYKAKDGIVINADFAIIDHTWIWRADHGNQVGWMLNQSNNGLVVNGDHVVTYGLHSEHFQVYDVLWNGDNGRCYFLQNERPYDAPPTSGSYATVWRDTSLADPKYDYLGSLEDRQQGFAAFRVGDNVKNFEGWALVSYDVFVSNAYGVTGTPPTRIIWSGFITPAENANIKIHRVGTLSISGNNSNRGYMEHIINGLGQSNINTGGGPTRVYPPGGNTNTYVSASMPSVSANDIGKFQLTRVDCCFKGYKDGKQQCTVHPGDNCFTLDKPTICFTVLNTLPTAQKMDILVAAYDSANRLIGLTEYPLSVRAYVSENGEVGNAGTVGGDSGSNATTASYHSERNYTIHLDVPKANNIDRITLFLWDGITYVPLWSSIDIPKDYAPYIP